MEFPRQADNASMRVTGVRKVPLKAGRTIVAGARRCVRPLGSQTRPSNVKHGTLRPAAVPSDPTRGKYGAARGSTLFGAMGI